MDHYSLELLAKLHHKGLVREGVRAQSVSRRLGLGRYRSRRLKQPLLVATAIALVYFRFFL